jgi:hypothetical protein
MKRNNLTAAVLAGLVGAAGIAGSAQAVNQNPDGLGQVLIYPYYTTNGGNQTLLSVVNTTDNAKAVKVRFLEGENSQEVLDFNLYMSAYDVWVAAIFDIEGTPTLLIPDTSCTVPYLYGDGVAAGKGRGEQPFLSLKFASDGGTTTIDRANEGHFEMIEMGTLHNEDEGSAANATHTTAGVPFNCQALVDAWTDPNTNVIGDEGYWLLGDASEDISAPSGGMFGGAAIVNNAAGTMYSYDAIALNGYNEGIFGGFPISATLLHNRPGREEPSLNSGNQNTGYVFQDNGDSLDYSFDRTIDAVSYVFMHDAIMNEYNTEDGLAAGSEWVVTFPTKRFYVDASIAIGAPIDPFTDDWSGTEGAHEACEAVILDRVWDREEADFISTGSGGSIPPVVSPSTPGNFGDAEPFELCYETNVIRFGDLPDGLGATELLGATTFTNFDNDILGFDNGWVRIDLVNEPVDLIPAPSGDGVFDGTQARGSLGNLSGLPATGFWVESFKDNDIGDGVQATYGGIFSHKGTRAAVSCDGTCSSRN